MQAFKEIVGDGSKPLTEFDEPLFEAMVEKVLVKSTTEVEFAFESGQRVKAKVGKYNNGLIETAGDGAEIHDPDKPVWKDFIEKYNSGNLKSIFVENHDLCKRQTKFVMGKCCRGEQCSPAL
jgi:hypothetical protein